VTGPAGPGRPGPGQPGPGPGGPELDGLGPGGPEPGVLGPGPLRPTTGGPRSRTRLLIATTLLAAIAIAWAAAPAGGARPGFRLALVLAIVCGAASLGRLAVGDAQIGGDAFDPLPLRAAGQVAYWLRAAPWSEGLIIAILALEALHHSRPWHTAVLGVALLAYLFATHLAETSAGPGTLAPQLPVLAAGLGLLVLAIGAAALPQLAAGPAADLLRALAVLAAVIAGGLALPAPGRRAD
jgi:hypothetical protein